MTIRRIYITGAAGMLGRAISDLAIALGFDVYGCDVAIDRQPWVAAIDIRDRQRLMRSMNVVRPDAVIHCAAMLGVQNTEDNPTLCRNINERGTENVVTAARESGAERFMFLSSSEVYGDHHSAEPLTEDSDLLGRNVYAAGKANSEKFVARMCGDMSYVNARMFNCYGPYQVNQFFVPKTIKNIIIGKPVTIFGSADNKRSYLFSSDAAAHLLNILIGGAHKTTVNVASPEVITLGEVVQVIASALNRNVTVNVETQSYEDRELARDTPNRVADLTKLRQISRYEPDSFIKRMEYLAQETHTIKDRWNYNRSTKV